MGLPRRRVLAATASTIAASGAGCLSGGGGGDDTERATDTATATETATDSATRTDVESTDPATTEEPSTTASTTESTTTGDGAATVQVRSVSDLGGVLVGADGMTLYMFDRDAQGDGASACTDGCASAWPPLTVEEDPIASADVTADLSTFERADGATQVAANGWPLYYYASDSAPGDATGQGVGDVWWVLRPDGTPVRSTATTTEEPGTTTSGPGYGY